MKRFAMIGLALAGCTTGALPPGGAPSGKSCGADRMTYLVGKTFTDALENEARQRSGARNVRSLRPGTMATMDFRVDRLNIDIDDRGVIRGVRCG